MKRKLRSKFTRIVSILDKSLCWRRARLHLNLPEDRNTYLRRLNIDESERKTFDTKNVTQFPDLTPQFNSKETVYFKVRILFSTPSSDDIAFFTPPIFYQ